MLPRTLAAVLLLAVSAVLYASGPYSPPRATPQRDDMYNEGKNVFWGGAIAGQKMSCAGCHSGKDSLNRAKLTKVKYNLESQINVCLKDPKRANGTMDNQQMEALVHYLAKRFRL
jgi:hypothetical protein